MFRVNSRISSFIAVVLVAMLCSTQYVAAEIPHENFDLVGSDLDMLVELLRQGINATELALVSCIFERPWDGTHNLTLLDGILSPVRDLISKIEGVASSYNSLAYLIPPFENLSYEGHSFIRNQTIYLSDSELLFSYVGKSLSTEDADAARFLLIETRTTIFGMNSNLDSMDLTADDIANLTVEGKFVFDTTYLKELIDRLRILLDHYLSSLDGIFFHIKWGKPVLLLVSDRTYYYLGETVNMVGYLSNGTTELTGKAVYLWKDFVLFDATTTDADGKFEFNWGIPIDPVELGRHNLTIECIVEGQSIADNLEIYVLKIPTKLTFALTDDRYSPGDQVVATAYLQDYKDRFLPKQIVVYRLDGRFRMMITSGSGSTTWSFNASSLDWGGHSIFAQYNGSDIYESCLHDVLLFDVNLLTTLNLELSDYRVQQGLNVTVKSRLYLNGTTPMPDMEIYIKMDGVVIKYGWTMENGSMIFTLQTGSIPTGAHILRAYFNSPEPKYKDAVSEAVTLIVYVPSSENNDGDNNWWDIITNNILWIILLILIILVIAIMLLTRDTVKNAQSPGLRRKTPEVKLPEEVVAASSAEPVLPAPYSPVSGQMRGTDLSIAPPKLAIISQYGILLESLRVARKMPILSNMTAREIGELLRAREYPSDDVRLATRLFEKAMYSAEEATSEDWTGFKRATESLIGFVGKGAT